MLILAPRGARMSFLSSVCLAGGVDGGEGEEGQGEGVVLPPSSLPAGQELPHLAAYGGSPGPALVLHGLGVHAHLQAPAQPAAPALVPVGLVHLALRPLHRLVLARVLPPAPDRTLEEARAAVTRKDAVVLARAEVRAHLARNVVQDTARLARGLGGPNNMELWRPKSLGLGRPKSLGLGRPKSLELGGHKLQFLRRPKPRGFRRPKYIGLHFQVKGLALNHRAWFLVLPFVRWRVKTRQQHPNSL